MNNEKLHERIEDNLKSEIYEKVKKLYKPDLFYIGGVNLEEIQEEFSDINKDIIRNLLDELVFCDGKLIRIDGNTWFAYWPK